MSLVPWNLGSGPLIVRPLQVIMAGGSDSFGDLAFEGRAQAREVQVAVDATELLAGLDHPGCAPAHRQVPVAPASRSPAAADRRRRQTPLMDLMA